MFAAQLSPAEVVFAGHRLDATQSFDTFRIPALCLTAKGTLLAFAEGRESVNDQAANVIVLRRKLKKTAGWSKIQVVVRDEPASLNNPCVLATKGGRVWMMYQRYPFGTNERTTATGLEGPKICRSFVVSSDDDGTTWGTPRDITSVVKRPEIQSDASGPGIGIELERGKHAGRLLFPFNEGAHGQWTAFSVYSDDGGKTWERGVSAPKLPGTNPNETQFVELSDGSVMLNARNQGPGKFRLSAFSKDGGQTWSEATPVKELIDPVCMGSILRFGDRLLFSNPASTKTRENGTLWVGTQDGRAWTPLLEIEKESFAYSCLAALTRKSVGILYESVLRLPGDQEGYRILYREIPLAALLKLR